MSYCICIYCFLFLFPVWLPLSHSLGNLFPTLIQTVAVPSCCSWSNVHTTNLSNILNTGFISVLSIRLEISSKPETATYFCASGGLIYSRCSIHLMNEWPSKSTKFSGMQLRNILLHLQSSPPLNKTFY